MRLKVFFITLYSLSALSGADMTMHNVKEHTYNSESLIYILHAEQKSINSKNLKKINLFNAKEILSKSIFYEKGSLKTKELNVSFQRAFFYGGDLYMSGCYSLLKDGYIEAESAVYKKDVIEYKNLFMRKDGKLYRKFSFTHWLDR